MSHEGVIASAVVATMGLLVALSLPMTFQDKAEAALEAVVGQVSRPAGAALMIKDAGHIAATVGCSAYLLDQAMDAYRQGNYSEAMDLDQRRLRCFRTP